MDRFHLKSAAALILVLGLMVGACAPQPLALQATVENGSATSVAVEIELTPSTTPVSAGPTPTEPPAPAPTATATPTGTATPTATPRLTPTPAPSLRQLTRGGCCTQPFFSPDGEQILFIDKPAADAPAGIYGVTIASPEPAPVLINDTIGFRSPDRTIVAQIDGDLARFTNEFSGESWTIDTGSNWPRFSPDGQRVSWVATDREGPYDQRQSDVWLAELDGSNRRQLFSTFGGRTATWFPDSRRLLLIGREAPSDEERILFIYDVETGDRTNLFSHKELRGGDISPDGRWVAYFLTFADDPADNGLWLIDTDDATRRKIDLPRFGGYRWRDAGTLLFVPFRDSADDGMTLWQIDVLSGQAEPLIGPETLSFSISNGDWEVSPDGQAIVFVSGNDQSIWLITLPS